MAISPGSRALIAVTAIVCRTLGLGFVLVIAISSCSDGGDGSGTDETEPNPNLVVITLDTTRRDYMGFHGRSPSPTPILDQLAAESVVFDDAYTSTPLTLPAHSTLQTGLYPTNHRVRENSVFRLPPSAITLAEYLQDRGYETAATVSAFVLDPDFGIAQGFDQYIAPERDPSDAATSMAERTAGETIDSAIEILDGFEGPFFLWVHLFDPHFPYTPPTRPADLPDPDDPGYYPALYTAEIAYADAQIGRLWKALQDRGFGEDDLLVFAADHGECMGDGKESTHGHYIYDETMRIPLFIRHASLEPGRIDYPVTLADVMPTALSLLGRRPLEGGDLDGIDLSPWMRDGDLEPPDRMIALESYNVYLQHGWAPFEGVVEGSYKYIHSHRDELYERDQDPAEEDNIVDQQNAVASKLEAGLEAIFGGSDRHLEADRRTLSAADQERLRQLGYTIGQQRSEERPDFAALPDPHDRASFLDLIDRATLASVEGRHDDHIALLRQAVEAEPDSALAHERLGTAILSFQRERLDDAEAHLERAVSLNFDRATCHFNLGLCKTDRARRADARRAQLADAGDAEGAETARSEMIAFQLDAKLHYECALQCEPSHPKALINLATLQTGFGRRAAADQDWELAEEMLLEAAALYRRFFEVIPEDHADSQRFQRILKTVEEQARFARERRGS